MADLIFRKASACEAHSCLEVATTTDRVVVRDTKLPSTAPNLTFTAQAWGSFLSGVRAGDLRP